MIRLFCMVAGAMATGIILSLAARTAQGQEAIRPAASATESQLPEQQSVGADPSIQVVIDRYEKILLSRPQIGTAFDKFYEHHSRQGTLAEYCLVLDRRATESSDGKLFHLLGLVQLRNGLTDAAIASLKRSQNLRPMDAAVKIHLSQALTKSKDYLAALKSLQSAADDKPTAPLAIEIIKQVGQLAGRSDPQLAANILVKLAEQFPSSAQVIEKLAPTLAELDAERARPLYSKLIELTREPQRRVEIQMESAQLMKRLGQPEQTLSELEKLVVRVKPGSWLHSTLIEKIEQLTEELLGADGLIERYERALSERPDDVTVMLRLAKLLGNADRFEDARAILVKANRSAPSETEPLIMLVDLLEKAQRFDEAASACRELTEMEPGNVDFIVRAGQLMLKDGSRESLERQAEAATMWRRMLMGHEQDAARRVQLAELFSDAAMSEEAIKVYREALELDGAQFEFQERFAEYLQRLGRKEEARDVLLNAVGLASRSANKVEDSEADKSPAGLASDERQSLVRASTLLDRWGFRSDAIATLKKACEFQPQFADLLNLAQLLAADQRDAEAQGVLARATKLAIHLKEFNAVWDALISVYKRDVELADRVVELKRKLAEAKVPANAASLQPNDAAERSELEQFEQLEELEKLALMQAALGLPLDAAETIHQAASTVEINSLRMWFLAARLEREAGLSFREIDSLRKLAELDVRNQAEYLQRVATIQFQQNQIDEALKTLDLILQSPAATLVHYQMAWTFCLQAKLPERSIDYVRKATAAFANERAVWLVLSQRLTAPADRAEAIDAAWRALELSPEESQQKEVLDLFWAMYGSKEDPSELLDRIERFGVAEDREDDADKWIAWSLRAFDQRDASLRLAARVLERSNASAELLHAAVDLSVKYEELEQALKLQKQLSRLSPSARNQLRAGELMGLNDDWQGAIEVWSGVVREPANAASVVAYAKELTARGQFQSVIELAEVAVETKQNTWELLALGIHANVELQQILEAAKLADVLLAINLPHGSPATKLPADETPTGLESQSALAEVDLKAEVAPATTARDRLAWLEHAGVWQAKLNEVDINRVGYRTNQMNPRSAQAAAVRHLAIQRGAAIRSAPKQLPVIECFGDARALAVLAKFGKVRQRKSAERQAWLNYVDAAIVSKNVDQLWDCVLVMEPWRSRAVTVNSAGAIEVREDSLLVRFAEVLDALVDLSEKEALELAVSDVVSRRHLQYQMASRLQQNVPAMNEKEITRLEKLVHTAQSQGVALAGVWEVTLAVELKRANRGEDADIELSKQLSKAVEPADIERLTTASLQIHAIGKSSWWASEKLLLRAFELELKSGKVSNELQAALRSVVNLRDAKPGEYYEFLNSMIAIQAKYVSELAPDAMMVDSRLNTPRRALLTAMKNGTGDRAVPVYFDRSSLLSNSLKLVLSILQEDEREALLVELTPKASELQTTDRLSVADSAVRWTSVSAVYAAGGELEAALKYLRLAIEQGLAPEVATLQATRVLVGLGRAEEAMAMLASIEPLNETILREVELWRMELALASDNDQEARRAAQSLANLPLEIHDSREVATVLSRHRASK